MTQSKDQREEFIRKTFDRSARRYDLLNRVISFHLDTVWRKKTIRALELNGRSAVVLDLGTGTGDLALAAAKEIGDGGRVLGLDFSLKMLRLAQAKMKGAAPYGFRTLCVLGSALEPPFKEQTFDAVMTAFVLRNISDLNLFFVQAYRLLKPGGKLVSLDMFPPSGVAFSFFYSLYFYRLMPWIGASISQDRGAYHYLSESVRNFHPPETIGEILEKSGFRSVRIEKMLRGAVCLHSAERPA
jgi:demethylmenaquinone methyltransferase/2-methoxy-6-polyprenyl-1,4-benzoquinol methylase